MWHLLLKDMRLMQYIRGSEIFTLRAVSRLFAAAALVRLREPLSIKNSGDFESVWRLIDSIRCLMRRLCLQWTPCVYVNAGRFELKRSFYVDSMNLFGTPGRTFFKGELHVRGNSIVKDITFVSRNPNVAKHSRQLMTFGIRILPAANVILQNLNILTVQGCGLFVGPDALVKVREVNILDSLLCSAYLDHRAQVHFKGCCLEGQCWGIECMDNVYLFLENTKVHHLGAFNIKTRSSAIVIRDI